MKEMHDEVALDRKITPPEVDIARRLAKLRGQDTPTVDSNESNESTA